MRVKVIKSNIEARYASLVEGTHEVSLFHEQALSCHAVYLAQHQEYSNSLVQRGSVVITIIKGVGELHVGHNDTHAVSIPLMQGDVVTFSGQAQYSLQCTTEKRLICSVLEINYPAQ